MTTSVMFVTYNRLELTKRMLDNFYQTVDVPYRLLIVDNGSKDGTPEWLADLHPELRDDKLCAGYEYFLSPTNMGISRGRNQALKMADTYNDPWLCTLDNDVELPSGWLKECLEIIQTNPNYSIGVNMEGVAYPLVTKNGKTFQHKPDGNLGTACTVFNRNLHRAIGFFCTDFGLYGEEDADFFFRARRMGYQIGYIERMGTHFGVGELDTGEYRKFKDGCRTNNVANFQKKCHEYVSGKRSIYLPLS